jgi:hypothetical protein
VSSGRTDTVEANGWTQNIRDKLHQTVTGSGWQHVTGAWKHDVDGENHDDYGAWKTDVARGWTQDVKGDWSGKFANGSVTFDAKPSDLKIHSGGTIAITAPTEIKIEASTVDCKSTGFWSFHTNVKNETFIEAGSAGVIKFDECGIAQAMTGMKVETTGIAITNAGCRNATFGGISEAYGAASKKAGANIKTIAADVWTGAFKKA